METKSTKCASPSQANKPQMSEMRNDANFC